LATESQWQKFPVILLLVLLTDSKNPPGVEKLQELVMGILVLMAE
jgi:hypothetical protein